MPSSTILITGGYGCIGAETAKWLLQHTTAQILICSRTVSEERTQRIFQGYELDRLTTVPVDIANRTALDDLLAKHPVSRVVHLAALQTPDCDAHRDLGLQVNLAGTQHLIESLKSSRLTVERFVFASSIAVYGPRTHYPEGRVSMLASPQPVNVYGAWKLAGEQLSRIYCEETGIPTLCLRPGVLYGPGRDAGLTSTPTTAMKQLALGKPYEIPFDSRQDYLFAPDVGAAFGIAATEPWNDFGVFTLPSHTVTTSEFVKTMQVAAAGLGIADKFQITIGGGRVPFICDLDYQPFLNAFPTAPLTPLASGVRESIAVFLDHAQRGWIS